jgi:sugar lactone lactonase YvrE
MKGSGMNRHNMRIFLILFAAAVSLSAASIGRGEAASQLDYPPIPGQSNNLVATSPSPTAVPPWATTNQAGGWLLGAPSAVLFAPGTNRADDHILVSIRDPGTGAGLVWLDPDGRRLGDRSTNAWLLARDAGTNAVPGVLAYSASVLNNELLLDKLLTGTNTNDVGKCEPVLKENCTFADNYSAGISGLAVRNGLIVVSLPKSGHLLVVDAAARKALGTTALDDPRGLAFDRDGQLLALSGQRLVRFSLSDNPTNPPAPQVIISQGLDDPQQITLDGEGIYISDRGKSHQVKVFRPNGKSLRTIGEAGEPAAGPYDPEHMNNPGGLTISGDGHLWVAEEDTTPKRVSVWTLKGKLVKTFYGPPKAGCGYIDPEDNTRLFYAENGGMEFKLDWKKGASELLNVYCRPEAHNPCVPGKCRAPDRPIHLNGRVYLTDAHNADSNAGPAIATVWLLQKGIATPVAAVGSANDWGIFGLGNRFSVRWTGELVPRYSEDYTFSVECDNGVRLWIDGTPVIDNWNSRAGRNKGEVLLKAGHAHGIRMEYRHSGHGAVAMLFWQSRTQPREIVPKGQLFPDRKTAEALHVTGNGLTAQYYTDCELSLLTHTCIDGTINFNWGNSIPPPLRSKDMEGFESRLPEGADLKNDRIMFAWSDLNVDGKPQPDEVTTIKAESGSISVMPDLSITTSTGYLLKPDKVTRKGVPVYDAAKAVHQ